MANEPNTPDHRWYERRNNIALSNEDLSRETIFDSGIQKINSWINSQPWGFDYPQLVLDFDDEYYRVDGGDTTFAGVITHTRASTATYVDSTGTLQTAAINEPRLGHHVYNGTAWVNEGLLHESEARTNLITYSAASVVNWVNTSATLTDLSGDYLGVFDGLLVQSSGASFHRVAPPDVSFSENTSYTVQVLYAEPVANSSGRCRIAAFSSAVTPSLNLIVNGPVGNLSATSQTQGTINWVFNAEIAPNIYLCEFNVTFAAGANVSTRFGVGPDTDLSGDGVVVLGEMVSQTSSPIGSYIPTAGTTVTRSADVLTIPAANLPYPEPVVIGPELVTNGTFDTDLTGWSNTSSGTGSATVSGGQLSIFRLDVSNIGRVVQEISTVAGKLYFVSAERLLSDRGAALFIGTAPDTSGIFSKILNFGVNTTSFVAQGSTTYITLRGATNGATTILDNISVREINPLALSIQMDGRVTYADTDSFEQIRFVKWENTSPTRVIQLRLETNSTNTGKFAVQQIGGDTTDRSVRESGNSYSPDVLVPFNIAGRFGSNFLNGANDGVALTESTDIVALPDLSATNLPLASRYNGTIRTFRMWGQDIGDAGLVEATEPSLVPSLSLTFDGTENSFIVEDWSA